MADTPDILDQAATQAPAPSTTAPAPPAGGDLLDQIADEGKTDSSLAESTKSWWDVAESKLSEGILAKTSVPGSPGTTVGDVAKQADDLLGRVVLHEISSAHPWRAQMAQWYKGSMEDAAKFVNSMTSPVNLAMMAASGSTSILAKSGLIAANLYFAYKGSTELMTARMENETLADEVERRTMGAAAIVSGTAGAGGETGDVAELQRQRIQKKLGLSGDLATKVNAKVQQIEQLRQQGVSEAAGETLKGAQETGDILDQAALERGDAQRTLEEAKEQIPVRMGQIVRDATHAVELERARVSKPFEDFAAKATTPVSDSQSVRASILDTIKSHGIQDQEIPPKIFSALFKQGKGSNEWMDIPSGPISKTIPDIQEGLQEVNKPVSFSDLTRVREDLYDAAQGAKDGKVGQSLYDAYDTITKMQEKYADMHNFGDEYRAAKNDYKNFKRELGNGKMADFLKAGDYMQQAMTPKLAKIMTSQDAEAFRGLLKMAGVDVSPLDDMIAAKGAATKTLSEKTQTAVQKEAAAAAKAGLKAGKAKQAPLEAEAKALGKESSVVPQSGIPDIELKGKTTEQIRKEALDRMATNAKQAGISNPMGMFMLIYGSLRLAMGSPFGAYPAVRGGASVVKGQSAKLLRNPAYQDWVIRESGVDPSNAKLIGKLRKGLSALANTAAKMAETPSGPGNNPAAVRLAIGPDSFQPNQ